MKVVVALSIIHYFRHFDKVVRRLSSHGHSVDVVIRHTIKRNTTDRALQAYLAETGTARFQKMAAPGSHKWYVLLWRVREMINYAIYFKPGHSSPQLAQRWSNRLPKMAQAAVKIPLLRKALVSSSVQQALRWIQKHIPLDATIVRQFREDRPDVVFASPFICEYPREADYIRTAIALKIPTIVAVASWDNLTTKGTFHAIPDIVLVWNKALLEEAVKIHDIPREKIIMTGAPTFDFWFDTKPSADRVSFCREVGLDADRPFIVYLCSSTSITLEGERSFVEELAANLRAQPDAGQAQILVRPHPLNAHIWEGFQAEDIHVWPRGGEWPDSPEAQQTYYDTLHHGHAVIGINTSAFLEAACMDKPCVTVLADNFRKGQVDTGHFHHLLNAGFLETAHNLPEAASVLAQILDGRDARADQRRRFVRSFIRPQGIDRSPSEIITSIIEQAATGKKATEIDLAQGAKVLRVQENGHVGSRKQGRDLLEIGSPVLQENAR